MTDDSPGIGNLILIPSVITLAVTLLRLIGELRHWSEVFFRRSVGGGGAIVGIAWLAVIFAVYFSLKLRKAGKGAGSKGKAVGLAVLALLLWVGGTFLLFSGGDFKFTVKMAAGLVIILAGLYVMRMAWPVYWNVMLTYAVAARIPVLIVMYLAIQGNWGTHYDAAPPNLASLDLMAKFTALGLIPQLFFWIPFTVIMCGLIGVIVSIIGKTPSAIKD